MHLSIPHCCRDIHNGRVVHGEHVALEAWNLDHVSGGLQCGTWIMFRVVSNVAAMAASTCKFATPNSPDKSIFLHTSTGMPLSKYIARPTI